MPVSVPFHDVRASTDEVRIAVERMWGALLDGDQFTGGASVERFEQAWADYCGTTDAIGVGSGTDAMHLALRAIGVGPGDEVVIPANVHVSTVEAVVLAGATPRFADVDVRTLLLDQASFEEAITPRTAAVMVVHLYGQMADVDAICDSAARSGIAVLEDASHAHGATWRERHAGSLSRAGCFSFDPHANLGALGDAGAVVTSDPALASTVRALRQHGRAIGSSEHLLRGTSSPLDSVQADVLTAKLAYLDEWTAARASVARRYREAVSSDRIVFVEELDEARSAHHLSVVRVAQRGRVRLLLESLGVETRIHYPVPLHLAPPYVAFWSSPVPVVEQVATEVISLPMSPHLSAEQVERVCHALSVVDKMLAEEGAQSPVC